LEPSSVIGAPTVDPDPPGMVTYCILAILVVGMLVTFLVLFIGDNRATKR
jgi:hypothetical protein